MPPFHTVPTFPCGEKELNRYLHWGSKAIQAIRLDAEKRFVVGDLEHLNSIWGRFLGGARLAAVVPKLSHSLRDPVYLLTPLMRCMLYESNRARSLALRRSWPRGEKVARLINRMQDNVMETTAGTRPDIPCLYIAEPAPCAGTHSSNFVCLRHVYRSTFQFRLDSCDLRDCRLHCLGLHATR